jgi:hypothetical protein
MRKLLSTTATVAMLSSPAYAASGSWVASINTLDAPYTHCIEIKTADADPTLFHFSDQDGAVTQKLLTINNSFLSPLTFTVGTGLAITFNVWNGVPNTQYHTGDCPTSGQYITSIKIGQ